VKWWKNSEGTYTKPWLFWFYQATNSEKALSLAADAAANEAKELLRQNPLRSAPQTTAQGHVFHRDMANAGTL
jgi:hypothetical protein